MIGIVIVAHGGLAHEFVAAAEHVMGGVPNLKAVGLDAKDDLAERRREIEDTVAAVDAGAGVVILTDLFGGTPSNLSIAAMGRADVDVVSGVNLPMIIKLARSRGLDRRAAVAAAVDAGRSYIIDARETVGDVTPGAAAAS